MYRAGLDNLPQGFKHIMVSNDAEHGARHMTGTFVENMREVLKDVDTPLVMFTHLDNIFFERVEPANMQRAVDNMLSTNFDLLKFDRSGCRSTGVWDSVYDILDPGSMYFYSNQPTLWRTESYRKLFDTTQLQHLSDEAYYSNDMRTLGLRGLVTNIEHVYHWPVAREHQAFGTDYYSSVHVPFINALHNRTWNTDWHGDKIEQLRRMHNV